MRYSVYRHGETFYDDEGELWKDAIDKRSNADGDLKLLDGRVVKLIGFNFSEWVPWAPGMYWTSYGNKLRELAREHIENRAEMLDKMSQLMDPRKELLRPFGKTLSVISGVGAVRLAQHMTQDGKIKVLGATTYDRDPRFHHGGNPRANASAGVPVVMHERAYDKIKENVERRGAVKATVEGRYIDSKILGGYFTPCCTSATLLHLRGIWTDDHR